MLYRQPMLEWVKHLEQWPGESSLSS
jgi:hypothetical protein